MSQTGCGAVEGGEAVMHTEGDAAAYGESRRIPPKPPSRLERQVMRFSRYIRDRWYDLRNRKRS
jgi:hypothetical protein